MREYLLNNGVGIPVLGFGTWKAQDGEEAYQATLAALKAGYRHIDTAAIYKNEESVGRAIKDSGIPKLGRDEELLPRNAAVLDCPSDTLFVLIDGCRINVPIACLESG